MIEAIIFEKARYFWIAIKMFIYIVSLQNSMTGRIHDYLIIQEKETTQNTRY